ncbi:MAG: acetolactate decarboxylase [Lactobacillaceae bacterium]|jgi:acetolactate decarboxylase|nr:acetolactate decarboxylase [Lactobacillaceae bacterium]
MADKYDNLYQHGNLAIIMDGQYTGTMKLSELLNHGDTGIGTTNALGVEMIVVDGLPYGINGKGEVEILDGDAETVPYANMHYSSSNLPTFDLENLNAAQTADFLIAGNELKNTFVGVRIDGTFNNVVARAADKQETPFKKFAEVASSQNLFTKDEVTGTIIGYYSPELYNGASAAGMHLHFLSDDRTFGGHLLEYDVKVATATVQRFSELQMHFPVNSKEFLNNDIEMKMIRDSIESAE